jgi:hypothetical protein
MTTRRNPLRLMISRTPISVPIQRAYSTTYFLDTLACGHQVTVFPRTGNVNQKRHYCVECGEAIAKIFQFPALARKSAA